MPDQKNISSTSQNFLDIYDIINDVVILKNGSASVILTVNAMNFGLLAEQEQDSVIYSYAGLLNSINYPIQILIQSQTKDASSYLKLLDKREEETKDKLKKAWIRRYSKFVSDLIRERNVLDKKFFVVIPASSLEMGLTLGQDLISGFKEQNIEGVEKNIILEKAKNLLDPKRDHLIAQFNRIGLYARQLSTEEIIRLFYTNYNPEASEGQQITNSEDYTTALVQAQIRGNYMNDQSQSPSQTTPATPADETTNPASEATTPVTPAAPAVDPITPAAPVTPEPTQPEMGSESPVGEVSIGESPVLQKPTPMSATPSPAPVTPAAPTIDPVAPVTAQTPTMSSVSPTPPAGTVEITQPEMDKAPTAQTPTTPVMPEPTKIPTMGDSTPGTDDTQENINKTIDQIAEKPAK